MIDTMRNLYNSEDLRGSFLVFPLKTYHNFFATKIENSHGLKKLAWLIANVVTGIFAYPILGLLAGFGMLLNLTGISDVHSHNHSEKNWVDLVQTGIQGVANDAKLEEDISRVIEKPTRVIHEFRVTKQNVSICCQKIKKEIDALTNQFIMIYVSSSGCIDHGKGEVVVQLRGANQN